MTEGTALPNAGPPALLPEPPCAPAVAAVGLYAAVLGSRTANSVRAYTADYADFARYIGAPSPAEALDQLIALSHGSANAIALQYRAHLTERGLASATIARRLSALRSAVKVARMLGRVAWSLDVEPPRVQTYRDTRGPGREGFRAMLAVARARAGSARGRRDLALVHLLYDLGLRRSEPLSLDLEHVDLAMGSVSVKRKGKPERITLTLPPATRAALADWLAVRGDAPGPLFHRLDRRSAPGRLSGLRLWQIIRALGRAAGLSRPVRPHGLRHQAITRALELTGGDVRAVQRFSGHAKLDTLMIYDDNRRDLGGQVATLLAGED